MIFAEKSQEDPARKSILVTENSLGQLESTSKGPLNYSAGHDTADVLHRKHQESTVMVMATAGSNKSRGKTPKRN